MANPRVFISSTCYDLSEVRDALVEFIASFGFEAVLSERGDVFYHPDIHTHDSCLNEVGNCQLFVLIIGGRFGGSYAADTSKSIVNAEYSAARSEKIPVFTFVKHNVLSDHFVYQKNKNNSSVKEIVFPSIDDNGNAEKIFSFIDDVRLAPVNNGFFPFEFTRDITDLLKKQWAGMFYEYLEQRQTSDQFATATSLLRNISVAGDKVEELVKSLYRHIDTAGADEKIDNVDKRATARRFYEDAFSDFVRGILKGDHFKALLNTPMNGEWYEYIATATGGTIDTMPFHDGLEKGMEKDYIVVSWDGGGTVVNCPEDDNDNASIKYREQKKRFDVVKQIDKKDLKLILRDLNLLKNT